MDTFKYDGILKIIMVAKNYFFAIVTKMGDKLVINVPTRYHHIFTHECDVKVEKVFNESIKHETRDRLPYGYVPKYQEDAKPELLLLKEELEVLDPEYDMNGRSREEIRNYVNYLKQGGEQ